MQFLCNVLGVGVVMMLLAHVGTTHPVNSLVNELHCTCCNTQLLQTGTGLAQRESADHHSKEHLQAEYRDHALLEHTLECK